MEDGLQDDLVGKPAATRSLPLANTTRRRPSLTVIARKQLNPCAPTGGRGMDALATVRMVPLMSEPAAAAGVDEHRFGTGRPFTVGIEEEYMLLDPETFDLVPRAESILRAESGATSPSTSRRRCSSR